MGPNGRVFAHRSACPTGSVTGQLDANASARHIFAHRPACPAGSVTHITTHLFPGPSGRGTLGRGGA
jgi:hypothetical protein